MIRRRKMQRRVRIRKGRSLRRVVRREVRGVVEVMEVEMMEMGMMLVEMMLVEMMMINCLMKLLAKWL